MKNDIVQVWGLHGVFKPMRFKQEWNNFFFLLATRDVESISSEFLS